MKMRGSRVHRGRQKWNFTCFGVALTLLTRRMIRGGEEGGQQQHGWTYFVKNRTEMNIKHKLLVDIKLCKKRRFYYVVQTVLYMLI